MWMYTHVLKASSAGAAPSVWSETAANLSMQTNRRSWQMTRPYMLEEQNSWSCQSCVDSDHHYRPQSQWNIASRMSASVPSPALPVEAYWSSTANTSHSHIVSWTFHTCSSITTLNNLSLQTIKFPVRYKTMHRCFHCRRRLSLTVHRQQNMGRSPTCRPSPRSSRD